MGTGGTTGIAGSFGGSGGAPLGMPLELLPGELPRARVRWNYRASLAARGGAGQPYTFALQQGPLPEDVTLSAEGRLEGTPRKVGDYPVRVQVRDAAGAALSRDYVLHVDSPRYMAYPTFLSSSSTRTALFLADLTTPELETYELADGSPSRNAFSPDGRWLAFCNHVSQGYGEIFLVDTSGEVPGELVSLLDPGELSHCEAWEWSPDSKRLAYVRDDDSLWLAELSDGAAKRTRTAEAVAPQGFRWPAASLIFVRDTLGRACMVRLDFEGGKAVVWVVGDPQSTLLSLSPNGDLAFAMGASGYSLVRTTDGSAEPLGPWPLWYVSPTFELLLGRSAAGEFSIHSPQGAILPAPLRVGVGGMSLGVVAFANGRPALAQAENAKLVVTELRGGGVVDRALGGGYDLPRRAAFDSAGEVLVFADRETVWASDTTGDGALNARPVSQHGPNPQSQGPVFTLASSTPQLLAGGGNPYELRLVDVRDPKKPLVSPVGADLLWSEAAWSPDDTHLAILGGSPRLGRVLYLVTPDRPKDPTTIIRCDGNGGAEPQCPGIATFQP